MQGLMYYSPYLQHLHVHVVISGIIATHVHVLFSCGPQSTILFSQHLHTCTCTCNTKPVPIIFFIYQIKIDKMLLNSNAGPNVLFTVLSALSY